jgi:hypothetical protein
VPEVVRHGVSGLVVDHYADFPAAIHAADAIDPAACRAHARAHFDLPVMAAGYEDIYRTLATGERLIADLTGTGAHSRP